METSKIEEIILMLRKQKVYKFELEGMKIEFTAAAFYEELSNEGSPEKDEDDDEILYHSV
jgi:hypothetical protein